VRRSAVECAVVGRINNNGESCVASKRFIAVEAIADEFLENSKENVQLNCYDHELYNRI
jgi:succinate-semialdehyde dehydrogenase/glutarate-semialdehyde dehydrogenase